MTKKKKEEKPRDRDLEKRMTRVKYLMEKYGHLWRQKTVMGGYIVQMINCALLSVTTSIIISTLSIGSTYFILVFYKNGQSSSEDIRL